LFQGLSKEQLKSTTTNRIDKEKSLVIFIPLLHQASESILLVFYYLIIIYYTPYNDKYLFSAFFEVKKMVFFGQELP